MDEGYVGERGMYVGERGEGYVGERGEGCVDERGAWMRGVRG